MRQLLLICLLAAAASAQIIDIPNTTFPVVRGYMNTNFHWLDNTKAPLVNPSFPGNVSLFGSLTLGARTIGAGARHLPLASACPRCLAVVVDGVSISDATVGGGAYLVPVWSNGSSWSSLVVGDTLPSGLTSQYFRGDKTWQNFAADAQAALSASLALKAPLAAPVFTGQITVPDFTLATHSHQNAAGGGVLDAAAVATGIFDILRIPTGTSAFTAALGNHLHTGVYEPAFAGGTTLQYFRGDKTWQTFPTSLSSFTNDPGYRTANQSITWTAAGDISGSASGATSIIPTLTVNALKGASVPTLALGNLRYTGSAWTFDATAYQAALGFTAEDSANKSTNTSLGASNTLYPTQNAIKTYVDAGLSGKQASLGFTAEDSANKSTVTSLGASNTLYPTQNAVKTYADTKEPAISAGTTAQYWRGDKSWQTLPSAGGVAGTNGQLQYNNSGSPGGVDGYTLPNLSTTGATIVSLPTSGWTIFNSARLMDFSTGLTDVFIAQNNTINLRGIKRAVTVPYTAIALVDASYATVGSGFDQEGGIIISDGTKYESADVQYGSAGILGLRILSYTAASTFSAIVTGTTSGIGSRLFAWKLVNDGTHRTFYYFTNGAWVQYYQENSGTFLTETQIGIGGWNGSGGGDEFEMRLKYWSVQ